MSVQHVTTADRIRHERAELLALTERLVGEFQAIAAGRIMATVASSRSELLRMGLRGQQLLYTTETITRERLGHLHKQSYS